MSKACSFCGKPKVHAKGFCKTCYSRNKRNGTPERVKIKRDVECWSCGKTRPHKAHGLCSGCHTRFSKLGTPFPKVFANTLPCEHCSKKPQVAKGLCAACYYRLSKRGTLEYAHKGKPRKTCSVDGCTGVAVSLDLCGKHLMRLRRNGDPNISKPYSIQNPREALRIAWAAMHRRCNDPGCPGYENYGGRGIRVCEEWEDFRRFESDMGPKPSKGYSLDRVDVNEGYSQSNCRWATPKQQSRNKRSNVLSEEVAEMIRQKYSSGVSMRKIAEELQVRYDRVKSVIRLGSWS